MIAREMMTHKVYTVSPEATVQEVAQQLSQEKISGAPVIDNEGQIIGIITQADIIGKVDREGLHVSDIMSTEVISVDDETLIGEVARIMSKHKIKRVPVMCNGKMVGIISRGDIVHAVAQGYLIIKDW
jgi:predicted transcriptional regulator